MKSTIRNSVFFVFFTLMILSLFPKSPIQAQAIQPTAPVHILSSDGFIRNWLILGPFPNPPDQLTSPEGGYQRDFLQSLGGETNAILDYSTTISFTDETGTEHPSNLFRAQTAPSGIFHFDQIFENADYLVAYAFCYIQSDKDQQVTSYFGSNDDAKVWVNGELVHQFPNSRSCNPRQDSFTFQLKEGLNPVLIKICERWGDWAFVIEVFTDDFLAQMNQRLVIRALRDIQNLELRQKGTYSSVFSIEQNAFPEIQWVNPYQVEKLLGKFLLTVTWYDENLNQVTKPVSTGTYTVLVEGISPDSIYVRKTKIFYCTDQVDQDIYEGEDVKQQNWLPSPKIYESSTDKSIIKVLADEPAEAVEIAYLAENKRTSDKTILPPGKHPRSFERFLPRSQSCLYWLYLPEGYGETEQKWPVIIYLHGSFRQGSDLSMINTPIPPAVDEIQNDFPFIVITPQCPDEYDAWPHELLVDLIDEIIARYDADAEKIYMTGVSLGGRGTWNFALAEPERLAAIFPVCGTYDHPEDIYKIKDVPVWAFHGEQDKVVPFAPVNAMVNDLKAKGGNVKFTIYPDMGHDIGPITYANKELYQWLLEQRNDY